MPPAARDDRILLVMPNERLVRKATAAGFDVRVLHPPGEPDLAGLRKDLASAARRHRARHVRHFGPDDFLAPVLKEAWALGLNPNPPDTIRRLHAAGSGADPAPAPHFSVETLTIGGVHRVVGVTARVPNGRLHPAPVPQDTRVALEHRAVALLRSVDYRCGPAHTELTVDTGGPRVIRARARLGGDRIPLLVQLTRGLDLETAMFAGITGTVVDRPPAAGYSQLGYFPLPAGTLRTVASLDSISVLPYVRAVHFPYTPGDRIPVGAHGADHGYVVVAGSSPEETARRTAHALSLLRLDVRPG